MFFRFCLAFRIKTLDITKWRLAARKRGACDHGLLKNRDRHTRPIPLKIARIQNSVASMVCKIDANICVAPFPPNYARHSRLFSCPTITIPLFVINRRCGVHLVVLDMVSRGFVFRGGKKRIIRLHLTV